MHSAIQVLADVPVYLTWGWVSVSVPNLIAILATTSLFVLALVLPFPKGRHPKGRHPKDDS